MTQIDYYSLPPEFQAYLHALELREYYRAMVRLCHADHRLALQLTYKRLYYGSNVRWDDILTPFLQVKHLKRRQWDTLIPYYLVAGVGINTISRSLRAGQEKIYRIRERVISGEYRFDRSISPVFQDDPKLVQSLQHMLKDLTVMHGYRIVALQKPKEIHFD